MNKKMGKKDLARANFLKAQIKILKIDIIDRYVREFGTVTQTTVNTLNS